MKKTILGAVMFFAGIVSCAILLMGTMGTEWTNNGTIASTWWILSQYGLLPVLFLFVAITIIGLVLAIIGVRERD